MISRRILVDRRAGPAIPGGRIADEENWDDHGDGRGATLALAATFALVLGGVVLVVGLLVSALLTAVLCAVMAVCVVGLAFVMV